MAPTGSNNEIFMKVQFLSENHRNFLEIFTDFSVEEVWVQIRGLFVENGWDCIKRRRDSMPVRQCIFPKSNIKYHKNLWVD